MTERIRWCRKHQAPSHSDHPGKCMWSWYVGRRWCLGVSTTKPPRARVQWSYDKVGMPLGYGVDAARRVVDAALGMEDTT